MIEFKVGEQVSKYTILEVLYIGDKAYYALREPGVETPILRDVSGFDNEYSKKKALEQIEENLKQLKQCLRNAQAIADKHLLSFKVALDLPDSKPGEGYYGRRAVGGTYEGGSTDPDPQYPDSPTGGSFCWENSSLNC